MHIVLKNGESVTVQMTDTVTPQISIEVSDNDGKLELRVTDIDNGNNNCVWRVLK